MGDNNPADDVIRYEHGGYYRYDNTVDFGPRLPLPPSPTRLLNYHPQGAMVITASAGEINAMARRRSRDTNQTAQSVSTEQAMAAAANSAIRMVYGTRRLGGDLMWVGTDSGNLILQIGWCLGEVAAVNKLLIGGQDLPDEVTATHYLGTPTQGVDPTLSAAITGFNNDMVFTVAGQTVGLCYSVVSIPAGVVNGFPRIVGEIKGRKVYDPRDTAQSQADKSTWKYSETPALIFADFETSTLYGRGKTIDWDSVKTCANANDDNSLGEKRNTLNLTLAQRQSVNLYTETLARYANVFINHRHGKTFIVADRPTPSSGSINASDVKGLKLSEPSLSQKPTVVTIGYTDVSGERWMDAKAVAKLSGVDDGTVPWREQALNMPGITSHSQAYRYAVEQLNALIIVNLEGVFDTKDTGIAYEVGDVRTLSHPKGLLNEPIQITHLSQNELGRWHVQFIEYDAGRFSDAVVAGPNYNDTSLPSPLVMSQITHLQLTEELYQLETGAVASRIRATWDPIDYPYPHAFSYEVRVDTILVWQGSAPTHEFVTGAIDTGKFYTVYVWGVGTDFGIEGKESFDTIQAQGKLLPPGDVPQISAKQISADSIKLQWLAAMDIDVSRYEIRQGSDWESALFVDMVDGLQTLVDGLSEGSYIFRIKAIDSIRQQSVNDASVSVTLDLPEAPSFITGFEAGGTVYLNWGEGTGYVSRYELRYGDVGFSWDNGTQLNKINALRLTTSDIPASTWEIAVKSVNSVGWTSASEARFQVTVTLDTDAFLVNEKLLTSPTTTNMDTFSLIDKTVYFTSLNETAASLFTGPMSAYSEPLATYHASTPAEWLSSSADFGLVLSGTWIFESHATAINGTITRQPELSADGINWTQYSNLTVKGKARYARIRLSSSGDSTLKVVDPGESVRVSVVPRTETHTVVCDKDLWAVKFDGVDDYMNVPGTAGMPTGDASHTVECWFYIFALPVTRGSLIVLAPAGPEGHHLLLQTSGVIQDGVWAGGSGHGQIFPSIPGVQQWFHYASVYDASANTLTGYINGHVAQQNTNTSGFNLTGGIYPFKNKGGEYVNLKFHQLRYWNTVRTPQQIQDNLWKELTGTEPGLVGLWPGNDGSGTVVADLTTNNNDGLLQNGAGFTPRGTTVALNNLYAETQSISVTPLSTSARTYAADGITLGEHAAFFELYLFDSSGARVDDKAMVTFRGV